MACPSVSYALHAMLIYTVYNINGLIIKWTLVHSDLKHKIRSVLNLN